MNIASYTARPPQLVQALEALALRADNQDAVGTLFHELSGITVLVAKKFALMATSALYSLAKVPTVVPRSLGRVDTTSTCPQARSRACCRPGTPR